MQLLPVECHKTSVMVIQATGHYPRQFTQFMSSYSVINRQWHVYVSVIKAIIGLDNVL